MRKIAAVLLAGGILAGTAGAASAGSSWAARPLHVATPAHWTWDAAWLAQPSARRF